jgi:hypothetical protein
MTENLKTSHTLGSLRHRMGYVFRKKNVIQILMQMEGTGCLVLHIESQLGVSF